MAVQEFITLLLVIVKHPKMRLVDGDMVAMS